MSALSQDSPRNLAYSEADVILLPVKASTKIYQGAAVSLASGYARGLDVADTNFYGIALEQADNTSGSNGDIQVTVVTKGYYKNASVGSVAVTSVGSSCYALTDNDLTLTASGAVAIGKIANYISSGKATVYFESALARSI